MREQEIRNYFRQIWWSCLRARTHAHFDVVPMTLMEVSEWMSEYMYFCCCSCIGFCQFCFVCLSSFLASINLQLFSIPLAHRHYPFFLSSFRSLCESLHFILQQCVCHRIPHAHTHTHLSSAHTCKYFMVTDGIICCIENFPPDWRGSINGWAMVTMMCITTMTTTTVYKRKRERKKKQKNVRTTDITHIGILWKHSNTLRQCVLFLSLAHCCVSSSQKKINFILACCFDNVNVEQTSFTAENLFFSWFPERFLTENRIYLAHTHIYSFQFTFSAPRHTLSVILVLMLSWKFISFCHSHLIK